MSAGCSRAAQSYVDVAFRVCKNTDQVIVYVAAHSCVHR